jgi:hypothetical protein
MDYRRSRFPLNFGVISHTVEIFWPLEPRLMYQIKYRLYVRFGLCCIISTMLICDA